MQHLEDESKTYYNIQGLRQDSDKHPTYEDVSKEWQKKLRSLVNAGPKPISAQ